MTKAIRKTTIFFLVILMTVFCCGTSLDINSVGGFNGTPDSVYAFLRGAYDPMRCNLGDRVKISTPLCPYNMVQVTLFPYDNCDAVNPVATFDDQTFMCEEPGDFYFICSIPYVCDVERQKFQLRVGHYEPKSPTSAPAPASEPAPISPSPSPTSGSDTSKVGWFF